MVSEHSMPLVLVVDDDAEWLGFVCTALVERYAVVCDSDADEAVRLAAELKPAAIVLDVVMPGGKDGFTVFRDLANHPQTSGIPVVMFTEVNETTGSAFSAEAMGEYLDRAPAAFLEKPLDRERLLAEIDRVVSEARQEEERESRPL